MCKLGVSLLAFVIALPVLSVCWPAATQSNNAPAARVDGAFIRQNDAQTKDWPTIGLDMQKLVSASSSKSTTRT